MIESTLVSVVVPTRDRPTLLAVALASIRALEGPDLRFEILVGDNGGLGETAEVADRFGARLLEAPTPGAAAARNAALRAATGEFIAFLDDDDAWLPGNVRPQLAVLADHPGFDGAVGQVLNADEALSPGGAPWPANLPAHGHLFRDFLGYYPQLGATVVRASVLHTAGFFDERLTFDQDWDWHLRLALRHRVGFVPVPCVLFRQRAAGQHDALQWRRLGFAHRVMLTNLWRSGPRQWPRPDRLVGCYLRKLGSYSNYFSESAAMHLAAGNRGAARRALVRALIASPIHLTKTILADSGTRATLSGSVQASWRKSKIQNPKSKI